MRVTAKSLTALATLAWAFSQEGSDLKIRVSVKLVQVDAIVTGSDGKPVPGLSAKDFRILVDGKPQSIQFCNYIEASARRSSSEGPAVKLKADPSAPPPSPGKIKREEVRRTVVMFVDDLSMSPESVPGIRDGLRKFIEKQVQPGDLAAVVRASAGLGALQDFTVDKQFLLAAANQVHWNAHGRGEAEAFHPIGRDPTELVAAASTAADVGNRLTAFTMLTLSSLRSLVKGMAELPGRKSVIIFSDRLPLATADELNFDGTPGDVGSGKGGPILSGMRGIVDECLRAGVVLYAVDSRGLTSLRAGASDNIRPTPSADPHQSTDLTNFVWGATQSRRDEYTDNQQGGLLLSSETGGFMVTEANRIDAAIERIMSDQNGYYLIGFVPSAETFSTNGSPPYHKLKVEALPAGLHVRSHKGFFGFADEASAPNTIVEPSLATVLQSPFQSTGLGLYVRGTYFTGKKNASLIRAQVIVSARDLALSGPPINRSGIIHLLVKVFRVSGEQLEGGIDQRLRVSLNEEGYERALKYGLVYSAMLPANKPGPYQIRAACVDEGTGKMGSAGDLIVIPELKASKMALSGVVFLDSYGRDEQIVPSAGPTFFPPGGHVRFAFQVVNPHKVALNLRTRLFLEGRETYQSPVEAISEEVSKGALVHGKIDIPAATEAGEYWMRIEVTDEKSNVASQWARLTVRGPEL